MCTQMTTEAVDTALWLTSCSEDKLDFCLADSCRVLRRLFLSIIPFVAETHDFCSKLITLWIEAPIYRANINLL